MSIFGSVAEIDEIHDESTWLVAEKYITGLEVAMNIVSIVNVLETINLTGSWRFVTLH